MFGDAFESFAIGYFEAAVAGFLAVPVQEAHQHHLKKIWGLRGS